MNAAEARKLSFNQQIIESPAYATVMSHIKTAIRDGRLTTDVYYSALPQAKMGAVMRHLADEGYQYAYHDYFVTISW